MIEQKERPAKPKQSRDVNYFEYKAYCKYTKLSDRELKIYNELRKGKRTVTQLTIKFGFSDPRGYIRNIRNKGISVFDEWINKNDTRFKTYWIED